MNITPEQKEFYLENGYLIVPQFLYESVCDSITMEAERVAVGNYTNILNLHEKSAYVHDVIKHPNILTIADALQDHRMIPIGSIFFFCKPGNHLEQGSHFHQDNYAAKAPYGSYFVIGVALDDANEENGSLIIYPKTHKLGDLPNTPSPNFEKDASGKISKAYPIGNETAIPDGYEPLQLTYKKGDLIILHGHTLHGAPKNPSSTHWRRKIYLHYIKDGDPFWPGWNAKRKLIERD